MAHPRRYRRRRLSILLLPVALAVGVIGLLCSRVGPAPAEPAVAEPAPDTAPAGEFTGRALRPGENLALVLAGLGLPPEAARAAEAALAGTDFDFQRLMPGDSVTLLSVDSVPISLRYQVDLATHYEVRWAGGGAVVERVMAPVETTVVALAGVVRGSLWQSLLDAGANDRLAAAYTCILRHRLPRLRDMQPGDSFRLVVERLAVGDSSYGFGQVHALRYRGAAAVEAFHHARPDGLTFYCDADGRSLARVLDYPPIPGARRTSDFGPRLHPLARRRVQHNGLDYEAPHGTPVRAVAAGVVSRARARRGYGRVVDIEHPRTGLTTRYAHLGRYAAGIRAGAAVAQGDTIGYVGSSGFSSGAHLHFETRRQDRPVDPLDALPSGQREVAAEDRAEFERYVAHCRAVPAEAAIGR
ncbi:MAG: M23 family metallopeptidase [bacterium]